MEKTQIGGAAEGRRGRELEERIKGGLQLGCKTDKLNRFLKREGKNTVPFCCILELSGIAGTT